MGAQGERGSTMTTINKLDLTVLLNRCADSYDRAGKLTTEYRHELREARRQFRRLLRPVIRKRMEVRRLEQMARELIDIIDELRTAAGDKPINGDYRIIKNHMLIELAQAERRRKAE
jgi:hypothetical protein